MGVFDTIVDEHPLVFVIGAMAHGKIDSEDIDDFISGNFFPIKEYVNYVSAMTIIIDQ